MSRPQFTRRLPPIVDAAVTYAQSFGASVEVSKRGTQHYGLRITAAGGNRLVVTSSTCKDVFLLDHIKTDVRNALEALGVDTGKGKSKQPGALRERKHKRRRFEPVITYRREDRDPTPVRRTFHDQLRDWQCRHAS